MYWGLCRGLRGEGYVLGSVQGTEGYRLCTGVCVGV